MKFMHSRSTKKNVKREEKIRKLIKFCFQAKARNPREWASARAIDSNNWFTTMTGQLRWRNSDFEEQSRKKNINNSFVFMRAEYSYTIFLSSLRAIFFFFAAFLLSFKISRSIFAPSDAMHNICICYAASYSFFFIFLALIMMFV